MERRINAICSQFCPAAPSGFLSILRGGAGQGLLFAGRGEAAYFSAGRRGESIPGSDIIVWNSHPIPREDTELLKKSLNLCHFLFVPDLLLSFRTFTPAIVFWFFVIWECPCEIFTPAFVFLCYAPSERHVLAACMDRKDEGDNIYFLR